MITVIAPHTRPEFSANLLQNFERQRGVECRLLVVENGGAVGAFARSASVLVVQSAAHQADAMNAGLAELRQLGGGAWARFDDDDYYGPDYLAEVVASLETDDAAVTVSGTPWRFVMFDEGLHQFCDDGDFTGGTLAASTADVELFPRRSSDDLGWCRAMRARGARMVQRSPRGYCYDRRSRAAPRVIDGGSVVTRFAFGRSLFYGPQPFDAVDRASLEALVELDRPTDAEIFSELRH